MIKRVLRAAGFAPDIDALSAVLFRNTMMWKVVSTVCAGVAVWSEAAGGLSTDCTRW